MKLCEVLDIMKADQIVPTAWDIRFWCLRNDASEMITPITANVAELYADWAAPCDIVPENGTFIYGLEFNNTSTGTQYLVETPNEYSFEELMFLFHAGFPAMAKKYPFE